MLTDKNKEQFEKWFKSDILIFEQYNLDGFYENPFEMQIGVYLAYYDSLGVNITTDYAINSNSWVTDIRNNGVWVYCQKGNSRNEAYKEAFKKANDIINKQ